jgi:hypothetical protein
MLTKVAAKAHNSLTVTDELGNIKTLKKLNYVFAGGSKQDAVAVADKLAAYKNGDTLLFPDNNYYIVGKITEDFYKAEIIRNNLELILCNNRVTVSRQVVVSNNQGGVSGHADTVLYDSLPCKIIPAALEDDKTSDVYLNNYVIYLPSSKPIEIGDKLQFAHTYNIGKAEGIKLPTLGLQEISFDRDFRW